MVTEGDGMRQHIKKLVTTLAREQFGDALKKIRFSGPFEEEDLDADLILTERMDLMELGRRLGNIDRPLQKEGYDVLIGFKFDEDQRKRRK